MTVSLVYISPKITKAKINLKYSSKTTEALKYAVNADISIRYSLSDIHL